ncbi:MAG: NAD(P)H-dependent oxidoreductase [Bacteroidales bacterium]|nr:NAD(P)H-dependent oxidoreductase [Bacteroidales bacterium]
MKTKRFLLTLAALAIVIAGCGQNKKTEANQKTEEETKMKTLVAYFSATGTTKALAEKIASQLNADLYEIKPEVPYTAADLDWRDKTSRSTIEMQDKNSRPAMIKDLENAESYTTIYIGFPVWWYTAPTIINTFLESYDFSGKNVVFFATSGGSTIDKANAEFRTAYPTLKWKDGKVLNNASAEQIKSWIASLSL